MKEATRLHGPGGQGVHQRYVEIQYGHVLKLPPLFYVRVYT